MITPPHRSVLNATQKLPPAEFVRNTEIQKGTIAELSILMQRQITNVTGREIKHQQFVTAFEA